MVTHVYTNGTVSEANRAVYQPIPPAFTSPKDYTHQKGKLVLSNNDEISSSRKITRVELVWMKIGIAESSQPDSTAESSGIPPGGGSIPLNLAKGQSHTLEIEPGVYRMRMQINGSWFGSWKTIKLPPGFTSRSVSFNGVTVAI
jgi:hypothetical protein